MRDLTLSPISRFRCRDDVSRETFFGIPESIGGAFLIPAATSYAGYRASTTLMVIAADGDGWGHVSVSTKSRCPIWPEMMLVHRLCFEDHEVAVQFHVPPEDHVSIHPYVLHLWRPHGLNLPLPPKVMI